MSDNIKLTETMLACMPFGHTDFHVMPNGKIVSIAPMIFTVGLFIGISPDGYEYRYCFADRGAAEGALRDWKEKGFEGEPEGWIKRK